MPSDQVRAVAAQAMLLPPTERAHFIRIACSKSPELVAEVHALLEESPGETLEPSQDLLPLPKVVGQRIGPYKILEAIGEGGFGSVFMAEQERPIRRRVAIKVLKEGMDTRQVVARFEAERQALAMMDHPNIARVLDAGATEQGRPYFVMELVRGIALTRYCDEERLTTRERLELLIPVCHAVQHAHTKGIIHRDLKPSNVLVTLHDGIPIPKVIDFGIAKATQGRLTDMTLFTEFRGMIGTPAYMSPEQAEMSGLDVDARSDIFSLGVMLYELLTGETPFDRETLMKAGIAEIGRLLKEKEPPRPSTRLSTLVGEQAQSIADRRRTEPKRLGKLLKGDLDWIVMRAMEKDRRRRYETADAFAADIKRHLAGEPVEAGPPTFLYRTSKLVRRHKALTATAVCVSAALMLGVAGTSVGLVRARAERDRAVAAEQEQRTLRQQADSARLEAQASKLAEAAQRTAAEAAAKRASDEAGKALRTTEFLTGVLSLTDAEATQKPNLTVPELLGYIDQEARRALADQPLAEAQVHQSVGRALISVSDMRGAESNLRRSLDLLEALPSVDPYDLADASWSLSDALGIQGRSEAGQGYYRGWRRGISAMEGEFPKLASLMVDMDDEALHYRMRRVAEMVPQLMAEANRVVPAKHRAWQALFRHLSLLPRVSGFRKMDWDSDDVCLRAAIDIAEQHFGPGSANHINAITTYALYAIVSDKPAIAEQQLAQLISKYEGQFARGSRIITTARSTRAAALVKLDRLAEAEIDFRAVYDALCASNLNNSALALDALAGLARIAQKSGDTKRADAIRRQMAHAYVSEVSDWANFTALTESYTSDQTEFTSAIAEMLPAINNYSQHPDRPSFNQQLLAATEKLRRTRQAVVASDSEAGGVALRIISLMADHVRNSIGMEHPSYKMLIEEADVLATVWGQRQPLLLIGYNWERILVCMSINDSSRAEALSRETVALLQSAGLGRSWQATISDKMLGEALRRLNRFEEAEVLLTRSCDELIASERYNVPSALREVYELYRAWGKPDRLRKYVVIALKLQISVDTPTLAAAASVASPGVGKLYMAQATGKVSDADLPKFVADLGSALRTDLPPASDDQVIVSSVVNAMARMARAKRVDVRPLLPHLRRAVESYELRFGRLASSTAVMKTSLAAAMVDTGDGVGAEPVARDALSAYERALDPSAPQIVKARSGLVQAMVAQKRFRDVEQLLRPIVTRTFRTVDDKSDFAALLELVDCYRALNRPQDAAALLSNPSPSSSATRPATQPSIQQVKLSQFAAAFPGQAPETYERFASSAREMLKADPKDAEAMVLLAMAEWQAGHLDASLSMLDILDKRIAAWSGRYHFVAAKMIRANILLARGRTDDALDIMESVRPWMQKNEAPTPFRTVIQFMLELADDRVRTAPTPARARKVFPIERDATPQPDALTPPSNVE